MESPLDESHKPRAKEAPAIATEQLCRYYTMGSECIRALDDVSFQVETGETMAVLGPSGSGKSTLMHLIGGLDTPTHGKVIVEGADLGTMNEVEKARHRRYTVGFVFQFFYLKSHLNALENVELPLKIANVARIKRREIARTRLEDVGLGKRLHHLPSELSGGERQRVCIARALANDPKILLADEPSGNLDSRTGKEIMELFLRLNREKAITLLLVTHNPELAALTGRTLHLMDGRIA
jgi:putative ABC transport system ATP-binding protein